MEPGHLGQDLQFLERGASVRVDAERVPVNRLAIGDRTGEVFEEGIRVAPQWRVPVVYEGRVAFRITVAGTGGDSGGGTLTTTRAGSGIRPY
jgi:hypothetical protein